MRYSEILVEIAYFNLP